MLSFIIVSVLSILIGIILSLNNTTGVGCIDKYDPPKLSSNDSLGTIAICWVIGLFILFILCIAFPQISDLKIVIS